MVKMIDGETTGIAIASRMALKRYVNNVLTPISAVKKSQSVGKLTRMT